MNIESALLAFVFNFDNWAKTPIVNSVQKNYPGLTTEHDIPYSDKCPACKADLHYQVKKPETKRPCLVNIHGGGLIIGDKKNSTSYCYMVAGESDILVMNINYGMPSKELPLMFEGVDPKAVHDDAYIFPLQIRTHMDALRWVQEHAEEYNIDLDNVFVSGDSAGSQMTGMVLACFDNEAYARELGVEKPDFAPKGYIMNCGLYNMNIYKHIPVGRVMMQKFMGSKKPQKLDLWKYHNPIPFLKGNVPNALVVKGALDVMTIGQSDMMHKKLKEVGVNVDYYIGKAIPNSFHDFLLLAPTKEAKKCLQYTTEWILNTAKK